MSDTVDLVAEQRKVLARAGLAILFCALVMGSAYAWLPELIRLPTALDARIAFALQANLTIFLWVVIGVQRVSSHRYRSAADNQGSAYGSPTPALLLKIAFLQNTLEQAFIAVGATVIFASIAKGSALILVPASVLLFTLGRITFWIGYPRGAGGRAFGIVTTMIPSLVLYAISACLIFTTLVS